LSLLFLFTPAIPTAGTHSACQARSKVLQTKFTHSHGPSHPLNSCSYTAFKSLTHLSISQTFIQHLCVPG
jgi:hypothetical protein